MTMTTNNNKKLLMCCVSGLFWKREAPETWGWKRRKRRGRWRRQKRRLKGSVCLCVCVCDKTHTHTQCANRVVFFFFLSSSLSSQTLSYLDGHLKNLSQIEIYALKIIIIITIIKINRKKAFTPLFHTLFFYFPLKKKEKKSMLLFLLHCLKTCATMVFWKTKDPIYILGKDERGKQNWQWQWQRQRRTIHTTTRKTTMAECDKK